MTFETITLDIQQGVARLALNRPDKMNSFNGTMHDELRAALQQVQDDASVRVLVLTGNGISFSAGADLNWMRRMADYSHDENLADAAQLAEMLRVMYECPKPTIARVQGAALGGGTGLTAACDMAVASDDAAFSTSEVKFGIIPSAISPYVLRAIGPRHALRYFQSAERISAQRALAIGMVGEVVPRDELDACIAGIVDALLAGGPQAQQAAKDLIAAVQGRPIDDAVSEETAQRIARQRATDEARDGVSAFLDKRPPAWLA